MNIGGWENCQAFFLKERGWFSHFFLSKPAGGEREMRGEVKETRGYQGKFKLLNIHEAAKYLGYSPRSFYNMVSAGTIPVKPIRIRGRTLRWDQKKLDDYIEALTDKR
jgi:excisionase family DNA binding protein